MKRWLFNIAAALSLVLCIAWTALWLPEAMFRQDQGFWDFPHRQDGSYLSVVPDWIGLQVQKTEQL